MRLLVVLMLLSVSAFAQDSLRFTAAYDSAGFYDPATDIVDGMMRGSATYEVRDYGHSANLQCGAGGGSADYRAWVALLASAWDSLGAGAVIDSFRLALVTSAVQDDDTVRVYGLYGAVVEGVGEGSVEAAGCTWLDFDVANGYTWTLPGGDSASDAGSWKQTDSTGADRTATEYAKAFVGTADDDSYIEWVVTDTALIMDCYRNDRQFQVLLTHDNASDVRFASRENTNNETLSWLPFITVYYQAGAGTPASSGNALYRSGPGVLPYRSGPDGIAVRSTP